jgi:hypothetical protein
LCEREVPLTHRLPAICLLEMHREKGSLSLSLRFLLPMSELGQKRRSGRRPVTSGLPLSTDILGCRRHVSKVPLTDSCAARQTASPIANILTAQEQACFASSGAQKRSINGHFAVIFEKPRVAVQAQNFCFKSPILRPLSDSSQSTGAGVVVGGTRIGRLLASCFALLETRYWGQTEFPNGCGKLALRAKP